MTLNIKDYQKRKITELHLETLLDTLDRLHDAAYQDRIADEVDLSHEDIIGWLEDIIYTAQETITEINQQAESYEEQRVVNIASLSLIRLNRGG
jgi:ABC-type phosphate transport system ATPase subunit